MVYFDPNRFRFSFSSLSTLMRRCPYQFYCRYIIKATVTVKVQRALALGTAVHEAIEEYYKVIKNIESVDMITEGRIEALIDTQFNGKYNLVDYNDRDRFWENKKNFLKFEVSRLKTFRPYFLQLESEGVVRNDDFTGKVDLFFGGTIIDFKTSRKDVMKDDYTMQSSIYKILLESMGRKVTGAKFVFLSTGRTLTIPKFDCETVMQEQKDAKELILKCDQEKFFPRNHGNNCKWCDYQMFCELSCRKIQEFVYSEI